MSKLKKEDLEQDLLIEYSSRFMHFYNTHKAAVIGGAIGLVVVIGLIVGYVFYMNQQQDEAQRLLSIAEQELLQGDYREALTGNEEEFTLGFVQIADNYSNTRAGNLAHYYAAVCEYELGNYEQATSYMEEYEVPEGIMGVPAISLYANALMELGSFEEAAVQYERAANWDENASTTPLNLFKAAEAYREAGNNEMAIEHLDTIIRNYTDSSQYPAALKMHQLLDQNLTG